MAGKTARRLSLTVNDLAEAVTCLANRYFYPSKKSKTMKKFFLLTMLLPVLGKAKDIAAKVDELLTAYHKQGKFTGTVLIAKEGKIVFEKGYGYADLTNKLPNTPHTEFRIGSLTKPFTATLILQL